MKLFINHSHQIHCLNLRVHNLRSTCLVLVLSFLHSPLHLQVGRHLVPLQLQFLFRQPFFSPQLQVFDSFSYAPEMSNIIDHVGRIRALGSSRSRTSSHPQSTKASSSGAKISAWPHRWPETYADLNI